MPPSRSHRYRRNPRKCSAGRNLGRAPFDTARCELAGGQPFFYESSTIKVNPVISQTSDVDYPAGPGAPEARGLQSAKKTGTGRPKVKT